jgi:arylsulfatase A-like enzyme
VKQEGYPWWRLAGLATLLMAGCVRTGPDRPERLVLIVIDTLRRDHLSVYGADQPTPHIDALAARGQMLPNVLASFHQTSMSMGALFTGRTPSLERDGSDEALPFVGATWCGMSRFASQPGPCLPLALTTLAERLGETGYWTIGIASNEFLYEPSGFSQGFDDWIEVGFKPEKTGGLVMDRAPQPVGARRWTQVQRAALAAVDRRPQDRFFLYVHYMDVHDNAHDASAYARGVAVADRAVGHLLQALTERGLLEGSVVVLTSDHGERLGEEHAVRGAQRHLGNPSFQEVLEIPLIVAPAQILLPDRLLRSQDVFGLLLEIAGLSLEGSDELQPDELFVSELFYRTYLRGRWKSSIRREDGAQQLYDLERDPGERRDVAVEHAEVAEEHRRRIEELSARLSSRAPAVSELSEDDRERLRALGYLEDEP